MYSESASNTLLRIPIPNHSEYHDVSEVRAMLLASLTTSLKLAHQPEPPMIAESCSTSRGMIEWLRGDWPVSQFESQPT